MSWGLGDADVVAADGTTILSILKMTKQGDNLLPTYTAASDLEHAGLLHADVDTLDTTQSLEAIDLHPGELLSAQHGELGPKIRSIVQGPFVNRVHKDFPYFRDSWYKTPPKVRRMNPFVGCYMYVGMSPSVPDGAGSAQISFSPHFDDDLTVDEESINFHYLLEFNEYNDAFDQVA